MAGVSELVRGSGAVIRRVGFEIAFSIAALVVVAYGVSRALPSADPSRFDRGDAAWVGELARTEAQPPAPVAAPTSASLTITPADVAVAAAPAADAAAAPKPAKFAVAAQPPRRPKPQDGAPERTSPVVATATPVAATSSDFLGLSHLTERLPSRETILRPFNTVESTVATFLKHP